MAPFAAAAAATLTFFLLGDWGGHETYPWTTPGQLATAAGMGAFGGSLPGGAPAFVVALGDNFYALGLCSNWTLAPYNNSCPNATLPETGTARDHRFSETFESVYTAPSLAVPWYVIAGNQDALGNVSASIAYSALSPRWRHPDFYHAVRVADAGGSGVGLDILMLDLTLCYGIWSDPVHDAMCAAQLAWLDAQLAASTAGFLLVAGHYPVYSACAHGNTQWAIDTLLPRLVAHNVTAYLSGHDHCGEFMAPAAAAGLGDLVFVVSGAGDGCCYAGSNVAGVPPGSLKFMQSAEHNYSTVGGFASAQIGGGDGMLRFTWHGDQGQQLYTSPPLLPRARAADGRWAAPNYAAAGLPAPSAASPREDYAAAAAATPAEQQMLLEVLPLEAART